MKLTGYIDKKLKYCESNRNTLLIGDGGQSKSYQLIDLFKCYITNEKIIPIYVPLCESGTIEGGYSILNFIYREYVSDLQESTLNYEKKLISMFRNANHVKYLIICDGYNELLESFSHQAVSSTITKEIKQLSEIENVYLIISSRYILTSALFGDFDVVNVCNLSNEQIKLFVPNIEKENEQLVELLRSPFYLSRFLEYKEETLENAFSNSSVTAGELLYTYLIEHIPKKYEKEHSLDSKSPVLRKLLFCLTKLIPEFSAYMAKNKTHSISINEMSDCYKKIQSPHTENWSIADLLENYIVPCNLMYGIIQSESNRYLFCHENYQEFFAAIWWTNNAKRTKLSEELMQFPINVQIKKYIGNILKENRFENKKDCLSEPSPVEHIIEKNRGIINNKAVQKFNAECIEIMKISRNYSITANYSELDLTKSHFDDAVYRNSNFSNSVIGKNTLFIKEGEKYYDIKKIWSDSEQLVIVTELGEVISKNIIDGSTIYSEKYSFGRKDEHRKVFDSKHLGFYNGRCTIYGDALHDVYIDSEKIIINEYANIFIVETKTGNLISSKKAIYCKNKTIKNNDMPIHKILDIGAKVHNIVLKNESYLINSSFSCIVIGSDINRQTILYQVNAFFDDKNSVYCVANNDKFVFYNKDFNYIGEMEFGGWQLYERWNTCQNGWYIVRSNNLRKIRFIKIDFVNANVNYIDSPIIETNVAFIHVLKDENKAVLMDYNLEITIIDLLSGDSSKIQIPRFNKGNCDWDSISADDTCLCFYHAGEDLDGNDASGICRFNYISNKILFRKIVLEKPVYITNGEFGIVAFADNNTYLFDQSLVKIISSKKDKSKVFELLVEGNIFHCRTRDFTITFICNFSNKQNSLCTIDFYRAVNTNIACDKTNSLAIQKSELQPNEYKLISEKYVFSFIWSENETVREEIDDEGNTVVTIPTCSIYPNLIEIYSRKKDERKILNEIDSGDSYAFSAESNVFAVLHEYDMKICFYQIIDNGTDLYAKHIRDIKVNNMGSYVGCDFSGVNLDADTIQYLLDNGGKI